MRSDWALGGEDADSATQDDYHAHRIALGVPEGGKDYAFGDTFPHEALFDQLQRRVLHEGLLRRPGGRLAHAEPRHGAEAHRAGRGATRALPAPGRADRRRRRRDRHARLGRGRARACARSASTAPRSSRQRARRCAPAMCRVRIELPELGALLARRPAPRAPPHEPQAPQDARALPLGRQPTPSTSAITTRNGACR